MKSPKKNGIGEVVTDYGRRVMRIFKKGLLQRSLFDFYGDIKADSVKIKESSSVPGTPVDGDGGVVYVKSADGKLYFKSNEVAEVELSAADTVLTSEQVQDIVGAMFSSNTETNITVTYQDADGTIDLVATDTNTQLTTEEVQDIVGAMFTSNTETRISATYEDADGTIDLVVDDMTTDTNTNVGNTDLTLSGSRSINTSDNTFQIKNGSTVYLEFDDSGITSLVASSNLDIGTHDFRAKSFTSDVATGTAPFTVSSTTTVANLQAATVATIAGLAPNTATTAAAQPNITSLGTLTGLTVSGDASFTSDSFTITSANADDPIFTLKNTSNDTNDACQMIFLKDRGAAPAVGTNLGEVRFQGEDSNQNFQEYGGFLCEIDVATDGQESGQFGIWVATHDGELQYGLQLTGGSEEDEVDVSIGQGSNSLTSIAGNLQVNGNNIKDSGGNTIISSDGSGVVTMAGGNIAVGGSNANLNMNSGSDIILEADNNGGGNTSTIQYPDSGGTNRIILGADSDVAILSNRASNGTVEIRANTSTAGSGGEVTVVTVQDTQVDISKDLNVTGTITATDGAENIVLNSTASDGNPLLTFKQNSTRRAFIQLADNNGGFENHMRIASEYGPVSIAAASTAGSDTDTVYLMVEPTGVFKFGAADADAVLTTDGNMTFRIDADNDETGQKFSFENNASTEVGSLDESGNLSVAGNVLPGITEVKILPRDFIPDDIGRPAMIDDTSSDRFLESFSTAKLYANVEIPLGFKATHVHIYGSGTSGITVYEADVNSKTVTSKGTGNIGTTLNITDVTADATNYILIELQQASGEEVYGGIMTIAKV